MCDYSEFQQEVSLHNRKSELELLVWSLFPHLRLFNAPLLLFCAHFVIQEECAVFLKH